MIEITEHTRNVLLEVAKKKKIYVEGSFLKILKAPPGDKEFEQYLQTCKEKDTAARRKRMEVAKEVQQQNKELEAAAKKNSSLMTELQSALDETKRSEEEANELRRQAEQLRDQAVNDLDLLQKRTQFELIGTIVRSALYVIIGVGLLTTALYVYVMSQGFDSKIIESTWSNLFGILLTNSFSIVGTIMGVKYATDKEK
jgi:predicted nuclease with TOPRIM domain